MNKTLPDDAHLSLLAGFDEIRRVVIGLARRPPPLPEPDRNLFERIMK